MERVCRVVTPAEADRLTKEEYLAMTGQERLDLQARMIMDFYGGNPPRLERILTIAPLKGR